MASPERKRRRRLIALGVAIALLLLAGGAAAFVVLNQPEDVSNPNVEFREEPVATPEEELEPEETPKPGKKKTPKIDRFIWAHYGYSRDRRRYLPVKNPPHPPFREVWQYQGNVLLEFPPVIGGKRLYLLNDSGRLLQHPQAHGRTCAGARSWARSRRPRPPTRTGWSTSCSSSAPRAARAPAAARVAALDGKTGKVRWSRELASRSESSPLILQDTLYFGSENGTVYAMNARNGSVRWRFRADGAVKGGLALSDGRLYFGDYGGRAYSIRASDGGLVWKKGTSGGRLGLSGGNFYSTPAVAYGRVYMGNTDGRMYSFSAGDGEIAWSRSTGGYVYASPAVAAVPGYPPTVYFGSYSGRFYALDARSGNVSWSRGGYGRISGGATVIGDIVYFADLGNKKTYGLGARTGRQVFSHERGSYNPVVSDGQTLFLAGYHALYALTPLTVEQKQARRKARVAKARLAKQGQALLPPARAGRAPRRAARPAPLDAPLRGAQGGAPAGREEGGVPQARARAARQAREAVWRSYRRCVDRRNIGGR